MFSPLRTYSTVMVITALLGGEITVSAAGLLVTDPAELLIVTE